MNAYKQAGKIFDFAVDPFTAPTRLQVVDDKSLVVINNSKFIHIGYSCSASSTFGEIVSKWEHIAHHESTTNCDASGLSRSPLQSVTSVTVNECPHVLSANSDGILELWSVESSMVPSVREDPQPKKSRIEGGAGSSSMKHVAHSSDGGFKNGAKGWCDVAPLGSLDSSVPSIICCTSYYGRELKLYDLGVDFAPVRSITLGAGATALGHVEGSGAASSSCLNGLVVVAQSGVLCAYDPRQQASGGCVVRETVSQEPLWSVCANGSDVLVAGADRTVYTYDARAWRSKAKFRSTCKFDIAKLMPAQQLESDSSSSSSSSGGATTGTTYYVAGCDNELFVSDIKQIMPHSQSRKEEGKRREDPSFSKKSPAPAAPVPAPVAAPVPAASYTYEVELGRNKATKSTTVLRSFSRWSGLSVHQSPQTGGQSRVDIVAGCDIEGTLYIIPAANKVLQ